MTDFEDGDILITEHFAARVAETARGWCAEVCDAGHPLNGRLAVIGDKGTVVGMLVEKVAGVMSEMQ